MAVDYINTLGAGAGFNTKELVGALVEAERAPKEAIIQKKIDSSEAQVSALAQAVAELSTLRDSARTLNDQTDFDSYTVSNSLTSALAATVTSTASPGNHTVSISNIAAAQRSVTGDLGGENDTLNGGNAFNIGIVVGSVTNTISVSTPTPAGAVAAINAANLSVTAELIDAGTSGTDYFIKLTGETGSDNAFTPSSDPNSVLSFSTQQSAANASLVVDGTTFARATNTISNIIPGVTLSLAGGTSGSSANIVVNRDDSQVKTKITDFVTAYNSARSKLKTLSSAADGGALKSDSVFKNLTKSIHGIVLNTSSTPGSSLVRLSDLGISIDKTGVLSITSTTLDTALENNLSDVVTIFSGATNNDSEIGSKSRGIAGDLSKLIADSTSRSGYFTTQSEAITGRLTDYQSDLATLESRLANLKDRYTQQFLAMQQVIDTMNNTKDNLISTFDNLPYTNKN